MYLLANSACAARDLARGDYRAFVQRRFSVMYVLGWPRLLLARNNQNIDGFKGREDRQKLEASGKGLNLRLP